MKDLSVDYMGLKLSNPLIASSSPLTATADKIEQLAAHGIGAVVLKSIFEEQISGEAAMLNKYADYPEAADYLRSYVGSDYLDGFTKLVRESKQRVSIPVIASINCVSDGKWLNYARRIEEAGADALELNIFFLPVSPDQSPEEIEARYLDIVAKVTAAVTIPVSVKLSIRFTNILHIANEIYMRKAKGAVLYNRFFEPDIDIDRMEYIHADGISSPKELHNSLRSVALGSTAVPKLDFSVSTGVHSGADVVKSVLAGAKTVQLCSTLLVNGLDVIGEMIEFLSGWMHRNNFDHIADFRGLMNEKMKPGSEAVERVQYMKYFPAE